MAQVRAGGSHTVFLTTDGEVWTCGCGSYGKCGNGGTEDQLTPAPLETFEDQIIIDVQVGSSVMVWIGVFCGSAIDSSSSAGGGSGGSSKRRK